MSLKQPSFIFIFVVFLLKARTLDFQKSRILVFLKLIESFLSTGTIYFHIFVEDLLLFNPILVELCFTS